MWHGVQKDKCNTHTHTLPRSGWSCWCLLWVSVEIGERNSGQISSLAACWKHLRTSSQLLQGFVKSPHLLCPQAAMSPNHPSSPPSHLSGQREPWAPCTESRMITFCVYYIMRCHIPHNSPCSTYSGISPEEFCLVHCIYSHETKIRIHPPRTACKSKRVFIHQYECPVH